MVKVVQKIHRLGRAAPEFLTKIFDNELAVNPTAAQRVKLSLTRLLL